MHRRTEGVHGVQGYMSTGATHLDLIKVPSLKSSKADSGGCLLQLLLGTGRVDDCLRYRTRCCHPGLAQAPPDETLYYTVK